MSPLPLTHQVPNIGIMETSCLSVHVLPRLNKAGTDIYVEITFKGVSTHFTQELQFTGHEEACENSPIFSCADVEVSKV